MKRIILLLLFPHHIICAELSNMHQVKIPELSTNDKKIIARITYYSKYESGGDKIAGGTKAKEGITIAAHPDFKFGTKILIPALKGIIGNGIFTVQDRGSAVTKKVASYKTYYVFDVYVNIPKNTTQFHRFSKLEQAIGEYTTIEIL